MACWLAGWVQVLPADKQEVVAVLQQRGHIVGMTGDGVNDAPALAQAQTGIAVHGGGEGRGPASQDVF